MEKLNNSIVIIYNLYHTSHTHSGVQAGRSPQPLHDRVVPLSRRKEDLSPVFSQIQLLSSFSVIIHCILFYSFLCFWVVEEIEIKRIKENKVYLRSNIGTFYNASISSQPAETCVRKLNSSICLNFFILQLLYVFQD